VSSFENHFIKFGQAYGTGTYGGQSYSCPETMTHCQQETVNPPNTGFFGSPDAAMSVASGALLVAIAVAGAIYVIVSRVKRNKKAHKTE